MTNKLVAVVGPTAAGKTRLGVKLAHKYNGEIISADSRQVYKGLDIGTGKDLNEYTIEESKIEYHLIDIADPSEEFNMFRYKEEFIKIFKDIINKGKVPFMVGGSGMYLSAVIQDYKLQHGDFSKEKWDELNMHHSTELTEMLIRQKKLHNKTEVSSKERIIQAVQSVSGEGKLSYEVISCVIGVKYERDKIKKRITERLSQRLKSGMIEEVSTLLEKGISPQKLISLGLEYKYLTLYLTGELSYNDMFQKLNTAIHQFAKRQMTWFRKMEKEGVQINWVERGNFDQAAEIVGKFLAS
jgi:tRNA dimethylallyltransferase